jgi:hypothetical protein
MDDNDAEDILSQFLEYQRILRRELDFDSTWEQEREATGGALAGRAGGQGAQGPLPTGILFQGQGAQGPRRTEATGGPSMAATGAAPHRHPSRFLPSEGAVRAPVSPFCSDIAYLACSLGCVVRVARAFLAGLKDRGNLAVLAIRGASVSDFSIDCFCPPPPPFFLMNRICVSEAVMRH